MPKRNRPPGSKYVHQLLCAEDYYLLAQLAHREDRPINSVIRLAIRDRAKRSGIKAPVRRARDD